MILKVVWATAIVLVSAVCAQAASRVVSLDQCADQYVLALCTRADIIALSPRALRSDSYMRAAAAGLPLRRPSTEDVLAERPDIVVRSWGGGAGLSALLARRGVRVAQIEDAGDFQGVRANIRAVASALQQKTRGQALIQRMDAELAAAKGAWKGGHGLYLTSGGFTAGSGVLIDAMMQAAGMTNASTARGYEDVKLEKLVLDPPKAIVLGFFEPSTLSPWSPGHSGAMQRLIQGRKVVRLPASVLGCPAWFAADGALALAKAAP